MARVGSRGGKVVSSGRISVPVRPLSCKKRTITRKFSTTSADSGYSLCSTDSEDQVLVINKGLDRCAALLQDILQSDVRENTKPHKVTFPKAHLKPSVKVKKTTKKPSTASHVQREKGPESAVLFNCRLPTSTPTLSPRHSADPQDVGYQVYHQTLPLGGETHFQSSMVATPMTHSVPPTAFNVPAAPVLQTSTVPVSHQPTHQADMLSQPSNWIQDPGLLQLAAAHLAQLRSQESAYIDEHEKERIVTDTEEMSSDEEEAAMMDKATARDISCQTSFSSSKKCSPGKTEQKIKTVKYLLGEIKAVMADQDDGEALRLVTELEHNVSLLPAVVGNTNVHAEIALALQPLRSENTQLRRRLRILNQQLRERERAARSEDQSYEVTSLQSLTETLQQQLMESQKSLESQQRKNEELLKMLEAQKDENKTLSQTIREKEQEILQIQQQNGLTSSKLRIESEDAVGNMKSLQFKLESAEKENQILGITLRQRDAEVSRLRELTRTLQASMAKLLCDLGKDNTRESPGSQLTQAALDSYEKQLQNDQCPASTSIISYLKRLEMDQVIPSTNDQPDPAPSHSDPSADLISNGHINYHRPEPTVSSITSYSPQKLQTEVNSESCFLIGDEYKPDDTTYLPLASSPHKATFVRPMCTPPKVCKADRDVGDKINVFGASERISTIQRSLFNTTSATSDKLTKIQEPNVLKSKEYSGVPPPLFHHLRNLRVSDSQPIDQSVFDVMSAKSDWSFATFSTFTSHDEQDFRNGLAALDANIAKLQRTLQSSIKK
ncbi:coiled-coil domain-containing protein 14 isoform X2 [Pyxicephalus adspersus]|uniref:coiled-coil domain-containing protein 14 isoform X2 n=1 Tax=Pyxicephalus adspersus TaxID=30357 RepID=UPI003B5CF5FE